MGTVIWMQIKISALIEGVVFQAEKFDQAVIAECVTQEFKDRFPWEIEVHKEEGSGQIAEAQQWLNIETSTRIKDRLIKDLWRDLMIEQRRGIAWLPAHLSFSAKALDDEVLSNLSLGFQVMAGCHLIGFMIQTKTDFIAVLHIVHAFYRGSWVFEGE